MTFWSPDSAFGIHVKWVYSGELGTGTVGYAVRCRTFDDRALLAFSPR